MISDWPVVVEADAALTEKFEIVKEAVSGIRTVRKEKNIANKEPLALSVVPGEKGYIPEFNSVLSKIGNLSELNEVSEEVKGASSFRVKSTEYCIPLGDLVDAEEEIAKIEEELKYTKGFMNSVMKKLSNERFVNNAPEKVVEIERKKLADAEEKIKLLEERLESLK
jgi:valyl-tRNA synthetase